MFRSIRWPWMAVVAILACGPNVLHAQTSTAFGSRNFGSGIGSNATQGSSNFGQGYNTGGTGLGSTSFGTSGFGNSSAGTGVSGGTTAESSAGQVTGDARYLPENRQGAFVGADRGDTTNSFSQQQGNLNQSLQSQNSFFSQLSQQLQRNGNSLQQQNRNGQGGQQQIRVHLNLGFPARTVVDVAPTAILQERFTRLPGLALLTPVEVVQEGQVVVLRGRVATQSDRELAEGIAMLEPGVQSVRNELIVDQAETTGVE